MPYSGSDAFSGVAANPAMDFCADLSVHAGEAVTSSENTEVGDGVEPLTARAANAEAAAAIVCEPTWTDAHLARGQLAVQQAQWPVLHRKKPMSAIVKSGSTSIHGALATGEQWKRGQRGLICAATPASDFLCSTLPLAAGTHLQVFKTGRGTPYGMAGCLPIKFATRSALAHRWHDWMDLNAGRLADGDATIEDSGWDLGQWMPDVVSDPQKDVGPCWKLHNARVPFNPAPIA